MMRRMRALRIPALSERVRTVARNTVWLLGAQGVMRGISYAYTIVIARVLGVGDFGEYIFLITYITYFSILADFGLSRLLVRDVARDPAANERYAGNTLALKFVLALLAYALAVAIIAASGGSGDRIAFTAIVGLSLLAAPVLSTADAVFTAREEMGVSAAAQIAATVAAAGLGIGALALGGGVAGVVIAFAASNAAPVVFLLWMMRRRGVPLALRFETAFWRRAMRASAAYAGLAALSAVYVRIDTLMLTWMKDTEATGLYNAAYRLSEVFVILPGVLTITLFPALSRLHVESKERLRQAYGGTLALMAGTGAALALLLFVAASPLVSTLYGGDYGDSVAPLQILTASLLLRFLNTPNTALLASGDTVGMLLWFSLGTAGLNVALNLYFIPEWGARGAAATTVISDGVSFLLFTAVSLRYLRTPAVSEPVP